MVKNDRFGATQPASDAARQVRLGIKKVHELGQEAKRHKPEAISPVSAPSP